MVIMTLKCKNREVPTTAFTTKYICTACGDMSDNRDDLCYPAEWQYKYEETHGIYHIPKQGEQG